MNDGIVQLPMVLPPPHPANPNYLVPNNVPPSFYVMHQTFASVPPLSTMFYTTSDSNTVAIIRKDDGQTEDMLEEEENSESVRPDNGEQQQDQKQYPLSQIRRNSTSQSRNTENELKEEKMFEPLQTASKVKPVDSFTGRFEVLGSSKSVPDLPSPVHNYGDGPLEFQLQKPKQDTNVNENDQKRSSGSKIKKKWPIPKKPITTITIPENEVPAYYHQDNDQSNDNYNLQPNLSYDHQSPDISPYDSNNQHHHHNDEENEGNATPIPLHGVANDSSLDIDENDYTPQSETRTNSLVQGPLVLNIHPPAKDIHVLPDADSYTVYSN
ncbi:hypothetical protein RFI_12677 [Reticulomyxa filosa]|uniref:Uncharacterized protein n=1 Tax=Reticulomyxa filosa TaxID=46433 RepID=X6NGK6_RETFI|nr:hypothetical protein RFI_12677 [Reticulomyxa filosa]|eukprot:ETO24482.1 hypothetical protein RFI_12677 [Reticulomyxa filosa]